MFLKQGKSSTFSASQEMGELINFQGPRAYYFMYFPFTTFIIFFIYWFILCPIFWSVTYKSASRSWPLYWIFLFWFAAFFIWLLIMIILTVNWTYRCCRQKTTRNPADLYKTSYLLNKKNTELRTNKSVDNKYVTMNQLQPYSGNKTYITQELSEIKYSNKLEEKDDSLSIVIHHQMSGKDIKQIRVTNIQNTVEEDNRDTTKPEITSLSSNHFTDFIKQVSVDQRNSKLVKDTESIPSPPLSPRDLFFYDLKREADKAESNRRNSVEVFSLNKKLPSANKNTAHEKDMLRIRSSSCDKLSTKRPTSEASYFIADVSSRTREKAEVFLYVEPTANESDRVNEVQRAWTVNLENEKPKLLKNTNKERKSDFENSKSSNPLDNTTLE